jgi:hypothetical protein
MASGILGQTDITSTNTDTSIYTVPASKTASLTLSLVNRGSASAAIRVGLCASGSIGNAEFIEYETILPPKGVLERTGIVMQATKQLVVRTDTANISASAYGFEE